MKKIIIVCLFWFQLCACMGQVITRQDASYFLSSHIGQHKLHNSCKYTIFNNDTCSVVIMFTEDDITTKPFDVILKRKLFRSYGCMRLSMFAWEPNMIIEDCRVTVPELLVKLISPGESFNIIIEGVDSSSLKLLDSFKNHLIICPEKEFEDSKYGLKNFITGVRSHNYLYQPSYVIIDSIGFFKYFIGKENN